MDFSKYSNKAKEIMANAQGLAISKGHQNLSPEHILASMIDDSDNYIANIIIASSGNVEIIKTEIKQLLKKIPSVKSSGSPNIYFSQKSQY